MESAFTDWEVGQRYLQGLYLQSSAHVLDAPSVTSPIVSNIQVASSRLLNNRLGVLTDLSEQFQKAKRNTTMTDSQHQWVFTDLDHVLSSVRPLFISSDRSQSYEIIFSQLDDNLKDPQHSYFNISQMLWIRILLKNILIGYVSANDHRIEQGHGLTIQEFTQFVTDIWPFLLDNLLVGKKQNAIDESLKRFREGNLFSFSANGDTYFDLDEANDVLAFMLSTKTVSNRVFDESYRQCQTGPEDEFKYRTVDPVCFRKVLIESRRTQWSNFKNLNQFFNEFSSVQDWENYFYDFETAARKEGFSNTKYMDSTDAETMTMMTHYLEAIFSRYDVDHSGTLSYRESRLAFPQLRTTLREITGLGKCKVVRPGDSIDFLVESVFTFLLAKGYPPFTPDMSKWQQFKGKLALGKWWLSGKIHHGWTFEADRNKILKIFGTIGKMAGGGSEGGSSFSDEVDCR
jgi:hypothetical protein